MAAKSKDKVKPPVKSTSSLSPKKARCARSWAKGKARKQQRQAVQDAAHARNLTLRARGELTPWEQAKSAAKFRKGPGANLTEADKARAIDARARGGIPVVRLDRVEPVRKDAAGLTARDKVRAAKRGGKA